MPSAPTPRLALPLLWVGAVCLARSAMGVFAESPDLRAHSCYYWVVHGEGCIPGHTPEGVTQCLACAAAHNATLKAEGCTQPLIDSACHGVLPPTPPSPPSHPKPGALNLTLLFDAAEQDGAVCLDGSPAGYYWRPGIGEDAKRFLIVLNGGGWCYGDNATAVKASCAGRAAEALGTSTQWAKWINYDAHGVDSPNCTVSPFCRWSVAYLYYCDGLSFSGDLVDAMPVPGAKVSPIYFRGTRVLRANVAHLLEHRGLDTATEVVLSGHSAGGLATYLHADTVGSMLPPSVQSYRAMPDAGFFLDYPTVTGDRAYGRRMRAAFALGNASGAFNRECVGERSDPTDCIFPEHFAQHITTPLHVIQSQYDSAQMGFTLTLPCSPPKGTCNASMLSDFLQFGAALRAAMNASGLFAGAPARAIWSDACIAHTQGYYGDYLDNESWEVPAGSGTTLSTALAAWLNGRVTGAAAVHVDVVPWPDNTPCASAGVHTADFFDAR